MKTCSKCTQDKEFDEFSWKSKAKGIKNSVCKACQCAYSKQHYQDNYDSYRTKARKFNKARRTSHRSLVIEFLKDNPCVDCGEEDLDVLEFDHIEMVGNKAKRVAHFVQYRTERLLEEMAKCEVRCANCHSRRTRRMMGTSRHTAL